MFTYQYYLFLLVIILIGICCGLVVLFTKSRTIRIIFGVGLGLIVAGFLLSWLNGLRNIAAEEREQVGVYKLDIKESIMTGYDSTLYQGLTIRLNEDRTFVIDPDVPFLPGTKGTWKVLRDLESSFDEFHFSDFDVIGHDVVQFGADDEKLIIERPPPKYGQDLPQVRLLYFAKK